MAGNKQTLPQSDAIEAKIKEAKDEIKHEYRWVVGIVISILIAVLGAMFYQNNYTSSRLDKLSDQYIKLSDQVIRIDQKVEDKLPKK